MKKIILSTLIALSLMSPVMADTIYAHTAAWHTDNDNGYYSNETYGIGVRHHNTEVGAYRHSYQDAPDNGALDGTALYLMQAKTWQVGKAELGVFAGVTYGYPDWLKLTHEGFMPIAGVMAEYGRARLVYVPAGEKNAAVAMLSFNVWEF